MDWYPAESLCDEINGLSNRERLTLATAESDVYVYASSDEGSDFPTRPEGKPSKTLKQLLQGGAFLGPDAWWSQMQKFEQTGKLTLAASLVLGSLVTFEDAHLTRFWDPESIYFLTNSEGQYIHDLPYAVCSSLPNGSTEPRDSERNECETRFAFLARLLMEIECGVSLEHLEMNDTGSNNFGDFIYDQLPVDLSESKRSYLKAVQMCFRFQRNCTREYKRMYAHGHQGGQAAATKTIVHSIVQQIQKAVGQQIHARRTLDRGLKQPATDYCHCPSVSSRSDRLSISNGPRIFSPTTIVPPVIGDEVVQKEFRISTKKQVRFSGQSDDEEGIKSTISDALVDSPTTADHCELFGEANAQEYPKELCKSAGRWKKEFKEVRMKKTSFQSEPRIKVAVLDTGADFTNPKIRDNVCGYKSFIDGDATVDHSGHGTHIAGIIIDLTTNVDLYIGKVIESRECKDRRPIIQALEHARNTWKVDMISLSFGFRISSYPDLVQKEIAACIKANIIVFASASNDAGNKPRTYPGNYDQVLCIHSATGSGNSSLFNPSPVRRGNNFSFVGDCVKSCWPMARHDFDNQEPGQKYLSGTSIATPVAVSVAVFMINYIRKNLAEYHWNYEPCSPVGMRKIFEVVAHERGDYDWVSPVYHFAGGKNHEDRLKADLRLALNAGNPRSVCSTPVKPEA